MTEPNQTPDPYGALDETHGSAEAEASVLVQASDAVEHPARRRIAPTIVAIVGLVVSLAGWGWFASAEAREGWWPFGQHVAVGPDADGWAVIDTVSLRLSESSTAEVVDDVSPPDGFVYLVLELDVEATEIEQYRDCTVEVLDAQGRLFLAGREVPNGDPYVSSVTCGTSDPVEDPVPTAQSVLVLIPEGAEPVSVRVTSNEFPPATFIELPLP